MLYLRLPSYLVKDFRNIARAGDPLWSPACLHPDLSRRRQHGIVLTFPRMRRYAWWTAANDPQGIGWDPMSIMTIPLQLTGVFIAGPWCFAMIWTDRKYLPKPFQMGAGLVVLNVICGLAFLFFEGRSLYDDFLQFFQLIAIDGLSQETDFFEILEGDS